MTSANAKLTFVLVIQEATATQAGAAVVTIKLVAMVNLVSAFAAFYGAIDQLKHFSARFTDTC